MTQKIMSMLSEEQLQDVKQRSYYKHVVPPKKKVLHDTYVSLLNAIMSPLFYFHFAYSMYIHVCSPLAPGCCSAEAPDDGLTHLLQVSPPLLCVATITSCTCCVYITVCSRWSYVQCMQSVYTMCVLLSPSPNSLDKKLPTKPLGK